MTPDYKIEADGTDVTERINERLVSLTLVDKAGSKSDRLSIIVDDSDQVLEIPRRGAKLKLWLGFVETGVEEMGVFVVDDIDVGGPIRNMTIRASATDMTGSIKATKEKSWHDTTLGDIAKKIASDHGLKASIDPQLASIKIEHEDQTESDMQFLARLCMVTDCVFKVGSETLIITETNSGKSGGGKEMPTIEVSADQASSWNASLTKRSKYGSCKARWYDPSKGKPLSVKEGSADPELLLSKTYPSEELAERAARSALAANSSTTGKLAIKGLDGNPRLSAESKLKLKDFRVGVDELEWFVQTVTHIVTKSGGYVCDIDAEIKDKN